MVYLGNILGILNWTLSSIYLFCFFILLFVLRGVNSYCFCVRLILSLKQILWPSILDKRTYNNDNNSLFKKFRQKLTMIVIIILTTDIILWKITFLTEAYVLSNQKYVSKLTIPIYIIMSTFLTVYLDVLIVLLTCIHVIHWAMRWTRLHVYKCEK